MSDPEIKFTGKITGMTTEQTAELAEAWHLLNVLSANLMDDGPTWPRVLEWLARNENYRPTNLLP